MDGNSEGPRVLTVDRSEYVAQALVADLKCHRLCSVARNDAETARLCLEQVVSIEVVVVAAAIAIDESEMAKLQECVHHFRYCARHLHLIELNKSPASIHRGLGMEEAITSRTLVPHIKFLLSQSEPVLAH